MGDDPDARTNAWNPNDYDGAHAFVYEYGSDVVDLLDPGADERMLDLGCGTGHLTHRIAERGADVVGGDRSLAMVSEARTAYPDGTFLRVDARSLGVTQAFDAVFSNAMLHWIDDQDAVLSEVHRVLRDGGRFVAELGGTGNVQSIVGAVNDELTARGFDPCHPWYFPSVGAYASRLERHGFEVRYATLFDRPTELDGGETGLARWLEMFGDAFFAAVPDGVRASVVHAVEDRLREDRFHDGTWVADYRRLRFVAVRT